MVTADLLSPAVTRLMRSARRSARVTLTWDDATGRRASLTDRLNSALLLCKAAWAECSGRAPEVTYVDGAGQRCQAWPWRRGAVSARAYLDAAAANPVIGGMARVHLDALARQERPDRCAGG